jgi:hypothetical protein
MSDPFYDDVPDADDGGLGPDCEQMAQDRAHDRAEIRAFDAASRYEDWVYSRRYGN